MHVGIMQGRLSPPQGSQIQFFPSDWRAEFAIAQALGFNSIEWIFDEPEVNPLKTKAGRSEMEAVSQKHSVFVKSICADIFMQEHLTANNPRAVSRLARLLNQAAYAGIPLVGIPFLESNIPETDAKFEAAVGNLKEALYLDQGKVELVVEMDLSADRIIEFIEAVASPRVGVCYDTGNAMTFGFNAGADIRKLGSHIKEVHIKDRISYSRQSVHLGEGGVNFPDVFAALGEVSFKGLCILQAWRGENYLSDAKQQLEFVRTLASKT